MKIALTCDALISRQYTTSIIETILSLDENIELYTLVHKEREILGPIEMRKIHSSFLSSMFKDKDDWQEALWAHSFIIPTAAKKLVVPCHFDVVINISSGLSQGVSRCAGVYQITYLLEDLVTTRKPRGFRERMFSSYLKAWSKKSLRNADEVWLPYEQELQHPKTSVLTPFIKLEDFPLFTQAQTKFFPKDFITVDATSLTLKSATELMLHLSEVGLKYYFVGEDKHLQSLKEGEEDKRFFGKRCSGELAPLLAASRGHFTAQMTGFPPMAIQSLSVGVPVIMMKKSSSRHFIKENCLFTIEAYQDLQDVFQRLQEVASEQCHAYAKRYHELKFKAEVRRRLERLPMNKCQNGKNEEIHV